MHVFNLRLNIITIIPEHEVFLSSWHNWVQHFRHWTKATVIIRTLSFAFLFLLTIFKLRCCAYLMLCKSQTTHVINNYSFKQLKFEQDTAPGGDNETNNLLHTWIFVQNVVLVLRFVWLSYIPLLWSCHLFQDWTPQSLCKQYSHRFLR